MPNEREMGEAVVTQEDREAAASCARYFEHHFTADECVSGDADISTLVQILARHRLATRPPAPEDAGTVERVARALFEQSWEARGIKYPEMTSEFELSFWSKAARAALAALSRLDGEKGA